METCLRGFSYMPPERKGEVMDLKYIEGGELERTWKLSRRQRLKEQEQKIWDEFVKEQDIVKTALNEDPYQFLHQLPENCLKELLDSELKKMSKEVEQEPIIVEQPNQGEGDHTEKQVVHMVTFAEDSDDAPCNMTFHIFDDDNDENDNTSELDDEARDSLSPSTVRERYSETQLTQRNECAEPRERGSGSVKSSENVSNLIESSIYCARVKDLRIKINEEMLAIMASLDVQDVMSVERSELARRVRRSAEFCARFNRIYVYQLHRQMHDIKRHLSAATPFAKHTQFQSHMLRIVSLHQNYLQAIQVFHKSFAATSCLRESATQLHATLRALRDASALCRAVPAPRDVAAAPGLYSDELLATCDRLDDAVSEYELRVADFLTDNDTAGENTSTLSGKFNRSTKSRKKGHSVVGGRGKVGSNKAPSSKGVDSRLSMYSLDPGRMNAHVKSTSSKDNQSCVTYRIRDTLNRRKVVQNRSDAKSPRLSSPRPRRPLMRAPASGHSRPVVEQDSEIATMVENVDTSPSSHVSPERSPRARARRRAQPSPPARTPRIFHSTTPRLKSRSPRTIAAVTKPPQSMKPQIKKALTSSFGTKINVTSLTRIQTRRAADNVKGAIIANKHSSQDQIDNCNGDKDTELNAKDHKRDDHSPRDGHHTKDCHIAKNGTNAIVAKDTNVVINSVTVNSVTRSGNSITLRTDLSSNKYGNIGNPGKEEGTGKEYGNKHGYIGNPGKEERYTGKECTAEDTETDEDAPMSSLSKDDDRDGEKSERKNRGSMGPAQCEVTRLLRQLCSGDTIGRERISGVKNTQLLCIRGGSPSRQPSTPQLLRILEETIQKKVPKPMYPKNIKDPDRYRLNFNIAETTANRLFEYRTKFVQHMLTSPMYANSAVGKPWEMIGSVSDKIVDELLMDCGKEMEIGGVIQEVYKCETN